MLICPTASSNQTVHQTQETLQRFGTRAWRAREYITGRFFYPEAAGQLPRPICGKYSCPRLAVNGHPPRPRLAWSHDMADRWYYAHDGDKIGPWTDRQLRNLADTGQIITTDTIWKNDILLGIVASKVKNLFAATVKEAGRIGVVIPATKVSLAAPVVEPVLVVATKELAASRDSRNPLLVELAASGTDSSSVPVAIAPPIRPSAAPARSHATLQRRAVAGKGMIIISQDGTYVRFKKKCITCGHEDSCRSAVPIQTGLNRAAYFCPTCRKRREILFHGSLS